MRIIFKNFYVFDLVYHMLAHMPVNNASDLYSPEYIDRIKQAKGERFEDITDAMGALAEYYNQNFNRLAMVNFLPIHCLDLNSLKVMLEQFSCFTAEDRICFCTPFAELLQKEEAFYTTYWKERVIGTAKERKDLEVFLSKEWKKYWALCHYFHKEEAVFGISYSMTCNGRGLQNDAVPVIVVPFTEEEREFKSVFLQSLHEFTHQFTDGMLGENINMQDGSHDLSENLVILFDYYLIKKLCPQDIEDYLVFLSGVLQAGEEVMTEEQLLSVIDVGDEWKSKLQKLADEVAAV